MKTALLVLSILLVLMLCACAAPVSPEEEASVAGRLADIDAYKQSIPARTPISPGDAGITDGDHFRGVPYGSTRDEVMLLETQPVLAEYTNAIDFEHDDVFSNSMIPSYWFNASDTFYMGGYYMTIETMEAPLTDIYNALLSLYGSPMAANYFDYDGETLSFDTILEAQAVVGSGDAYYYAWFNSDDIYIELYARRDFTNSTETETLYYIYVEYTSYTYYDY